MPPSTAGGPATSSYPSRRLIRLRDYDYASAGAYVITLCVEGRRLLFGTIEEGKMRDSSAGEMMHHTWHGLPQYFPGIEMDEFIVMPNHLHGIMLLADSDIREYSVNNPLQWHLDKENPQS